MNALTGTWQLKKLVVHFCVADAASAGVRAFVLGAAGGAPSTSTSSSSSSSSAPSPSPLTLAAFALANPQLAIETRVHVNRAPRIAAEYADGSRRDLDVKGRSALQVADVVQRARDSASGVGRRYLKPVSTRNPTVQGVWDPSLTYEGFLMREAKAVAAGAAPGAAAATATAATTATTTAANAAAAAGAAPAPAAAAPSAAPA